LRGPGRGGRGKRKEGQGREGERGGDVEEPGKWSASGPALVLGGPGHASGEPMMPNLVHNIFRRML